jgi:hypothetical protein
VLAQQSNQPIMVRVVEQPVHETTIGDVILGSLEIVAILLVVAALLGLLLGGALIAYKRLTARDRLESQDEADSLRVTPPTTSRT